MKQPNPDRLVVMLRRKGDTEQNLCILPRNAHDGTLRRRVAPRLVVGRENSHVTATHKVVVVEAKQGVCRGEKFWVENHLHSIRPLVEQLAPTM